MIKIIEKNLRLIYNFLNLSHRKQTKSPEKNNLPQSKKRTPLFLATLKGNKEIVQLLFDNKCNLDLFCQEGLTPLHIAI